MPFSTPIYGLKRQARDLSRRQAIPLHAALDQVASQEGFAAWSHLAASWSSRSPADHLHARLKPGDLVLVGARPQQGKTMFCLELALRAMHEYRHCIVFTLEWLPRDVSQAFRDLGADPASFGARFACDESDAISADYIISRLSGAPRATLAVIDCLQSLDHRRTNPPLGEQVDRLARFAKATGHVLVFISQIDRSFETSGRTLPGVADIRLPNPIDLSVFDQTCFLQAGQIGFGPTL
jgi:hypothetical protein